jgi:hypothetical protein
MAGVPRGTTWPHKVYSESVCTRAAYGATTPHRKVSSSTCRKYLQPAINSNTRQKQPIIPNKKELVMNKNNNTHGYNKSYDAHHPAKEMAIPA